MERGLILPTKKPDADNIAKAIYKQHKKGILKVFKLPTHPPKHTHTHTHTNAH